MNETYCLNLFCYDEKGLWYPDGRYRLADHYNLTWFRKVVNTEKSQNINTTYCDEYHGYCYDEEGFWDKSGTFFNSNEKNLNYYRYCFEKIRTN